MSQEYLAEHLLRIHKKYERDFRWKNLRNIVLRYVCGKDVLDVGCGTGHMAIELKKRGYNVTAVDKDEKLVEFFKSLPESNAIRIECMDIYDLKSLGNAEFDCVTCLDVIEHIEDDIEALKNINYILKKNGRVIISVPAYRLL